MQHNEDTTYYTTYENIDKKLRYFLKQKVLTTIPVDSGDCRRTIESRRRRARSISSSIILHKRIKHSEKKDEMNLEWSHTCTFPQKKGE